MTDPVTRLRRAHRYDDAERLIKEQRSGAAAEVELGRIALQRERYSLAAEHFDRAAVTDPGCTEARAWQIAVLSTLRDYAAARALGDEVLAATPDAHLVRIARARVEDDEFGDAQYLLDAVDAVLASDPEHLEALEWRIVALRDLGRFDDAYTAARQARGEHPDAAELAVEWGNALSAAGRYDDAIVQCDNALRIHPEYIRAHRRRVAWLRQDYRFTEALTCAEQAAGQFPHASSLYLEWGITLRGYGDVGAALEKFERAVELGPEIARYHAWRAFVLRALNRPEEAQRVISAGRAQFPDDIEILEQEAWWHREAGDIEAAMAVSQRAYEIAPADPVAVDTRVSMLRYGRHYTQAETVAKAAIAARRFETAGHTLLGWIYSEQDRDEEALAQFRTAAALAPYSVAVALNVSHALRWLHRDAEAEDHLSRWTGQVDAEHCLAVIHEDTGRTAEALALYEKINRTRPEYVIAWGARASLLRAQRRFAEAEQVAAQSVRHCPFSEHRRLDVALAHRAQGDEPAAISVLRQACADLPHRDMLRQQLAVSLRLEGEYEQALDVLAEVPDGPHVDLDRIRVLRDARHHERAARIADEAIARYPREPRLWCALGDIRADLDDDEAALAAFDSALRIDPGYRVALRGKARCLRKARRYAEAERLLAAEVVRLPNYPVFRVELAWTYGQMERREDGLAQYERALEVNPRDAQVLRNYASALSLVGRWPDAERELLKAIKLLPDDADLLVKLGEVCDQQNRRDEALAWFDRALALEPRSNWALEAKSATLRSLGRFDEAERLLKPALDRKAVTYDVVVEWGWVLRDRGQLTRARLAFERALTLAVGRRKRAEVLHCLGWVAFSANDFTEATMRFRAALADHPHSDDAKIGLAWTLVREALPNGEHEAERLCIEVLDQRPRSHLAHTCLGVLYARQNNLPQAEHHLRRSIEIDPYRGSYVDLGALFVQMDRFDEAETLLRKAVERDWYDSQAHIELGGLYLQRDFEGGDETRADSRLAAQHFRHALVIDASRGAAAIGLSLALIRAPGDLLAAERVLRDAVAREDCDQPRWQLLVTLARLLIERGDATQRRDLHLEALSTAQQAIELAADQADPHYVAGVAAYKAGESGPEAQARPYYRRRALKHFRRCLRHDPTHSEARRVMTLAEQSLAIARTSVFGSVAMMLVAGGLLVAMWLGFFLTDKVTAVLMATLTPVLAGLVALGFVLPFLVRLKLPGGVEADLSASLSQVSSGPTGEVSIGPGRLVGRSPDGSSARAPLSAGPRGELPRLG